MANLENMSLISMLWMYEWALRSNDFDIFAKKKILETYFIPEKEL